MDIDIVSIDPKNPQFVRLENYQMRPPTNKEKVAVKAFYLPAINDNTSTLAIGVGASYIFTADLSGCLFAAYGPSADNITVEHVNVRTAQAQVPILPRAQAIINANYGFYKILSPVTVPNADGTQVKVYAANSSVVGLKIAGAWNFYYKSSMTTVGLL
jgi:hypothetical protein